jgi:hypothetical protein
MLKQPAQIMTIGLFNWRDTASNEKASKTNQELTSYSKCKHMHGSLAYIQNKLAKPIQILQFTSA